MKKIILVIISLLLITANIFGQEIPELDYEKIITINIGNNEGEVEYIEAYGQGGGHPGPTFYTFAENGNFYICDYLNKRINIYNSSFVFLNSIDLSKNIMDSIIKKIIFDPKYNLVLLVDMEGLYKINNIGEIIFKIPQQKLPKDVYKGYNLFYIDENLIYYDMKSEEAKIKIIDNNGFTLSNEKVTEIMRKNTKSVTEVLKIEGEEYQSLELFIKEKNLVVNAGKICSTDFNMHREYFEILNKLNICRIDSEKIIDKKNNSIIERVGYASLRGFDKKGCSYWFCDDKLNYKNKFIIVLSNKGELLDYFTISLLKNSRMTVSPEGDIYFIDPGKDGVQIFKTIK